MHLCAWQSVSVRVCVCVCMHIGSLYSFCATAQTLVELLSLSLTLSQPLPIEHTHYPPLSSAGVFLPTCKAPWSDDDDVFEGFFHKQFRIIYRSRGKTVAWNPKHINHRHRVTDYPLQEAHSWPAFQENTGLNIFAVYLVFLCVTSFICSLSTFFCSSWSPFCVSLFSIHIYGICLWIFTLWEWE